MTMLLEHPVTEAEAPTEGFGMRLVLRHLAAALVRDVVAGRHLAARESQAMPVRHLALAG